jgi:uncharacterized protein (TIGR02117 family)
MSSEQSASVNSEGPSVPPKKRTWLGWLRRWTVRCLIVLIFGFLGFIGAAWGLGHLAVNRGFEHAGEDGIEILVSNNGVHVDLVIPLDDPHYPWLDKIRPEHFGAYESNLRYGIIGWGNREFYMQTPTWDDLKLSTVLVAFAGLGRTVVHVSLTDNIDWPKEQSRKIRITPEQFRRLNEFLLGTFKQQANGQLVPIEGAHYRSTDAFYEANGNYHLFRTCNVWAGSALARTGVRVGYWTLTPDLLFACLPAEAESQ